MSAEDRVKELERANEELRRANVALARERHGASDTAAAGLLLRLSEAEAELAQVESSVSWRITAPLRWVKNLVLSLARAIRPKRPPDPE